MFPPSSLKSGETDERNSFEQAAPTPARTPRTHGLAPPPPSIRPNCWIRKPAGPFRGPFAIVEGFVDMPVKICRPQIAVFFRLRSAAGLPFSGPPSPRKDQIVVSMGPRCSWESAGGPKCRSTSGRRPPPSAVDFSSAMPCRQTSTRGFGVRRLRVAVHRMVLGRRPANVIGTSIKSSERAHKT